MNYEKKYKEALERAKRYYLDNKDGIEATMLEYIFPELQESEDERIREKLKHYLEVRRCRTHNDEEYVNCNHFLAWLEKQKDCEAEIEKAYKNADEVQYSRGYEDGVKSVRWTEEDENRMNDALRILSFSVNFNFSAKEEVSKWLYELKNRLTN